jgi:outer membrane biosynthesis protein TonB
MAMQIFKQEHVRRDYVSKKDIEGSEVTITASVEGEMAAISISSSEISGIQMNLPLSVMPMLVSFGAGILAALDPEATPEHAPVVDGPYKDSKPPKPDKPVEAPLPIPLPVSPIPVLEPVPQPDPEPVELTTEPAEEESSVDSDQPIAKTK